ncbi:3-oxoacyl-ACP synthase [Streptomyces sp. NBC_01214]|uniref:beta-ketoacyl synthase N-terminal-like domain-containing protein n=1 Tax=Streptomyces sp. NBC_01214 TaxID=2903777 RepID=UPI002256C9F8|nr:beta-ketoacyl synthase N-terminal-like domain-containing protein [Streptomyces sp. NBC_01214]MCX4803094.1 3-oxoacyl-ACP synthase [Streptomyces sp. NBC_01214]
MSVTATAGRRPVITAWSAVSPFGIGRAAFIEGIRGLRGTSAPLGDGFESAPGPEACLAPGFSVREALGRKGTRSMDRVTGLTVTAVGALLGESERNQRVGTGEGAAFALGTTTGSAQSMMDFTRDSLTGEQPFFVDPAQFPNTVMNCASGQSAIWYQLKGPNTTIAGGRSAGLHALNYARRLLSSGHAESVLCGTSEEFSSARAWLEHHAADSAVTLGEGSAMLLVEPAGDATQPVLAEILAVELGVVLRGDVRAALASCLRRAFAQAGCTPEETVAHAGSGNPDRAGVEESAAVAELLGETPWVNLAPHELIGDTGAAAAGFQIVSLLAYAETHRDRAVGRIGLVTAVDRTGSVGCALLRLH